MCLLCTLLPFEAWLAHLHVFVFYWMICLFVCLFVFIDGRIVFNTKDLREPTTHSEIKSIVKEAYDNNRKVRVLADGHSWSEIAQSEDILISLHKYSGLVGDIDKDNMEVTVRAGWHCVE